MRSWADDSSARLTQGFENADVPPGDTVPGDTSTTEVLSGSLGSAFGWINTPTDTDWYGLQTQVGQTYTIFLKGYSSSTGGGPALPDPILRIYDSSGQLIGTADNSLNSLDANYQYTPTTSGLIYVSAGSADGQTGRFSFLVIKTTATVPDVVPGDTSTGVSLAIGGHVDGVLENATDADWYRVSLTAGQSYMFHLDGASASPLSDSYLQLFGANGSLITFNDDYGDGYDSALRFTPTTTGVYYLSAEAAAGETGGYRVSAEAVAPQNPLDTIDWGTNIANTAITVYFAQAGQTFDAHTADRSWTASEISSVMAAFATLSAVSNVTFTTTASAAGATMIMVLDDALGDETLGSMSLPPLTPAIGTFSPAADVWNAATLQPGGLAFSTLIHEVGHALGLSHPHDTGGSSEIMEGVTGPFDSYGVAGLNQGVFTMMSYNDGWPMGPAGGPSGYNYGMQRGPMALDIAVLQKKYGATVSHAGDDVYTLPTTNGATVGYLALWDTGGNDTISASGSGNAVIDLRPATLLNAPGGGGYVSYIGAVQGGLVVAAGVAIENAYGANGADILTGNAYDNTLRGGGGADKLNGADGSDVLDGGTGSDVLDGGLGVDYAAYGTASTGVHASLQQPSTNTGDALGDTYTSIEGLRGSSFADLLRGDANGNILLGMAGDDTLDGGGGDDVISGGDGDDVILAVGASSVSGDSGSDTFKFLLASDSTLAASTLITDFQTGVDKISIAAMQPTNVTIGQANGVYTLTATTAAAGTFYLRSTNVLALSDVITVIVGQTLAGTPSYDKLVGGDGADVLIGKGAGDNLTGGAGVDIFRYEVAGDSHGDGYDILSDFQHGVDKIDLSAVAPTYMSILHAQGASYLFPSTSGGQMQIAAVGDVEANDILTGGTTNYYIVGDDSGMTLIGGDNPDSIVGGGGNDVIIGGGGGDALYGNGGRNVFTYRSASESNNQNLDIIHGFQTGVDKIDLSAMNPSNVSIVYYNGGTFINGGAADGAFQIASIDKVFGISLLGLTGGLYVVGENVAGALYGSAGADTIIGGSSYDAIYAGGSGDALFGGGGMDTFMYESGTDSNGAPGGMDIIHDFETGVDRVYLNGIMGATNVSVIRSNGGTFIFGNSTAGAFQIASTHDINPADMIGLTSGAYVVGDDTANTLIGGYLSESIVGGGGNDIIIGGGAADALFGGAGADTFKFLDKSDSAPGASDIIHDFQTGVDKIDLTALHTNPLDKFTLVSDANASYLFVQLAGNPDNDLQVLFATPNVKASDILW
ncbi:Ca2+-binding RTX toxin-like protein [Caulobacter sp. BK020]|nr:Ca2+-binding RTX toxin-like protein [Caulobacter sp. BK020]